MKLDKAQLRFAATAAALTLAFGAAACGDDDDGGGGNGGAANASEGADAKPQASGPEAEIRAVYDGMVKNLYDRKLKETCAALTPEVQQQLGKGKSCEERFGDMLRVSPPTSQRPYIVSMKVDGDRARAKVKTKTSLEYPVRFAKRNGEWKISAGLFHAR